MGAFSVPAPSDFANNMLPKIPMSRWFPGRFGPGTVLALILAIGLVAFRLSSDQNPVPRSQIPSPTRPLQKPEVGELLDRQDLRLDRDQVAQLTRLSRRWQKERASLLHAMGSYRPKRGSSDDVQASLADYSRLSREYDATRSARWRDAIALLTPDQIRRVTR